MDLEIPEPMRPRLDDIPEQTLTTGEKAFLNRVFDALEAGQPVLLLAQNGRDRLGVHRAILRRAQDHPRIGRDNCHHVVPLSDPEASLADYCAAIAHQVGLSGAATATDAVALEGALDDRLGEGAPLFVLITRLAGGSAVGRRALAGVLRNVTERHPTGLRLVLCGAEQLAALRFADGRLSYLNHAEALYWPEPTVADLPGWWRDDGPPPTGEAARRLLESTGGHPGLVQKCLRQWPRTGRDDCERLIRRDPELTALFTGYRQLLEEAEKARLRDWLDREWLDFYSHWPADGLLRRLFWDNLLVEREDRFAWRCEGIRELGKRVVMEGG